jgi:phospholipid/cholesterol/gamma-HCH transport system substrate-binding protein
MNVEESFQPFIKNDAIATLGNDGLMGNKLINISPGSSSSAIIKEGESLLSINELDADDMLRRLEETNRNVASITSSLVGIVKKVDKGEGTLGKLLNDQSLAADLSQSINNLRALSVRALNFSHSLEKSGKRLESKDNLLGLLLTDTSVVKDFESSLHELQQFSSNAEAISTDLKQLLNQIEAGNGTIGTLLTDSTANQNLKGSLQNIEEGTAAFRENMEALKHNFLLRRYFKKQKNK